MKYFTNVVSRIKVQTIQICYSYHAFYGEKPLFIKSRKNGSLENCFHHRPIRREWGIEKTDQTTVPCESDEQRRRRGYEDRFEP